MQTLSEISKETQQEEKKYKNRYFLGIFENSLQGNSDYYT
jgi:effector-binding domain-containing protein